VSEDYLSSVLRMMKAVRDHREFEMSQGNPGPITERDLDTCLLLISDEGLDFPTWLNPREFPALRRLSRRYDFTDKIFSCDGALACALVNRVGEGLGLPPVQKPLARKLLSALSFVSLPLVLRSLPVCHRSLSGHRFVPRSLTAVPEERGAV
jgi:hypothetical protein